MAVTGIPEVIHDFNTYNAGKKQVGTTGEVALPDLEALTASISGAGILGEYEAVVAGHFSSLEQEVPFRVVNKDFFDMIAPTKAVDLTLRGAIQYTDQATQNTDYMGLRVVFRGKCKKTKPGTVKLHDVMDASVTLELTYILIEMGGEKKLELDKLNPKYVVNGVDQLAKVRALT